MHSHQLNMMVGLLKLIGGCGGQIEGRVRIQKAAFLLGSSGVAYFDPQEFAYHHYGPYSRSLSDILHQAVSYELVEERRDSFFDDTLRYTYKMTEKGQKLLDSIAEKSDIDIASMAKPMKDFHWRALELAATIAFLEQHGDADNRSDALAKALHLKPACSGYADAAKEVLSSVGL